MNRERGFHGSCCFSTSFLRSTTKPYKDIPAIPHDVLILFLRFFRFSLASARAGSASSVPARDPPSACERPSYANCNSHNSNLENGEFPHKEN